jgi:hypothetical protein
MKDLSQLAKDFKIKADAYKRFQQDLPRIAGQIAVNVVKHNFDVGGFCEETDQPEQKWSDRDEKTDYAYDNYSTYKGSNYSSANPILQQTRKLRRGVMFKVEGENKVFIGEDLSIVPYAQSVNERVRNGVQDKFLDWSKYMALKIKEEITKRRSQIFGTWKK